MPWVWECNGDGDDDDNNDFGHNNNNDLSDYLPLIESLLVDYYDPMYNFQISKKKERIIFEGQHQEVTSFLQEFKP